MTQAFDLATLIGGDYVPPENAVRFRGDIDFTQPYPNPPASGPDTRPHADWSDGDQAFVGVTGAASGTDSSDGLSWDDYGVPPGTPVTQGDYVVWTGSVFRIIIQDGSFDGFLPKTGGVMDEGAVIEFAGAGGEIRNVAIDAEV